MKPLTFITKGYETKNVAKLHLMNEIQIYIHNF